MKKLFLFAFLLAGQTNLIAQTVKQEAAKDPHAGHNHAKIPEVKTDGSLDLKQSEYDFGKIPQGKPVYHYFEIVNKGTTPLILDNISTTCGCTTPEWSKEPVAIGQTTKIKVGYNAASEGPFEKPITITYNGNFTKEIKIKGNVWKAPSGPAPANASVQFLKQQLN
ncbi:MAG TPA: DUF1573 domain-containing protein [Chitinophagaceae bacterium]|nr:DUF1573 domain-containing protein [Chitinophagaceae bacterium]